MPDSALFAGCTPRERRSLQRLGTGVRVQAGTTLTPEGHPGKEFFVVEDGNAMCSVRGTERARFQAGDFFGEMALLDGGPRTATVTAETSMDLVVYSLVEFREMLDSSACIQRRLLVELARRLRVADAAA
ncbi:MAG TPA: cyclic nucleotide-binding domain-containing protein [Acidimicrobiales bacterium]